MIGKIHSLESFGTVDGPGIRFVVFMQGCPLRCLYCHNPDTWDVHRKTPYQLTPEALMDEVLRYKSFIAKGGVTVTGGEPLLQADFLKAFFQLCRKHGIHTALDTSGCVYSQKVLDLLEYTDLVLLDIKSIRAGFHEKLTGMKVDNTLRLLDYLQSKNIPVWIRHVIVPNLTDDAESLAALADYLKPFSVIEKVELLPYHTMGVNKYELEGMDYPLKDTQALAQEQLDAAKQIFKEAGLPVG